MANGLGGTARSWREMREWQAGLLERATGRALDDWMREVRADAPEDEPELRAWLAERGVTGYAQMLVVFERLGYPDFFLSTADELVDAQFADRVELRPVFDALLASLPGIGDVTVQARKTYVSLLTPRRTFAVVAPVTRTRLDLGMRWPEAPESPRLSPAGSRLGGGATIKVGLRRMEELDDEVLGWMREAYATNE